MNTNTLAVKGIAATVLATAMLSGSAYAANANTTQQGSLMVFPRIDVSPGRTTIVRIQNSADRDVNLKCYWQNGQKKIVSFGFLATAEQPVWFNARSGKGTAGAKATKGASPFPTGPGPNLITSHPKFNDLALRTVGELKCWAVNGGNRQIRHNFLSGNAVVIDHRDGTASGYNSWNFRANTVADGAGVGTAGTLLLNGAQYDTCPIRLSGAFSPTHSRDGIVLASNGRGRHKGPFFSRPEIFISGCTQDFRQDRDFYFTKLAFDVYDSLENNHDGAYHCTNSWTGVALDEIDNLFEIFSRETVGKVGRFEVVGIPSVECYDNGLLPLPVGRIKPTALTGLVGVLVEQLNVSSKQQENGLDLAEVDDFNGNGRNSEVATELVGIGSANGLYNSRIRYDLSAGPCNNCERAQ